MQILQMQPVRLQVPVAKTENEKRETTVYFQLSGKGNLGKGPSGLGRYVTAAPKTLAEPEGRVVDTFATPVREVDYSGRLKLGLGIELGLGLAIGRARDVQYVISSSAAERQRRASPTADC